MQKWKNKIETKIKLFKVAIKIIHKNRIENKQDLARVRREIEFMSRLNHPHIVKILEGKKH